MGLELRVTDRNEKALRDERALLFWTFHGIR